MKQNMDHLNKIREIILRERPAYVNLRQQSGALTWRGDNGWNAASCFPAVAYPAQADIERAVEFLRQAGIRVALTGPKSLW